MNPTLTKTTTDFLQAKYRFFARVRMDPTAQGVGAVYASLGSNLSGTATWSSTTYVWVDLGSILASSAGAELNIYCGGNLLAPTNLSVEYGSGEWNRSTGEYWWKVTALNANGETIGSNEVDFPMTDLGNSAALSWTAVPGATSYKLYRSTSSGGESTSPALVANPSTNSYTDTGTATTSGAVPGMNTAAVPTYIDRYEAILVEDRVRPGAQYNGVRDLAQAALQDSRALGAISAR